MNTQQGLSFLRTHWGRAGLLFLSLDILPGMSWQYAAVATAAISIYAFIKRCEAAAADSDKAAADFVAEATQTQVDWVTAEVVPVLKRAADSPVGQLLKERVLGVSSAAQGEREYALEAAPQQQASAVVIGDLPSKGSGEPNVAISANSHRTVQPARSKGFS